MRLRGAETRFEVRRETEWLRLAHDWLAPLADLPTELDYGGTIPRVIAEALRIAVAKLRGNWPGEDVGQLRQTLECGRKQAFSDKGRGVIYNYHATAVENLLEAALDLLNMQVESPHPVNVNWGYAAAIACHVSQALEAVVSASHLRQVTGTAMDMPPSLTTWLGAPLRVAGEETGWPLSGSVTVTAVGRQSADIMTLLAPQLTLAVAA